MFTKDKRSGFTLVELLVVISIILIASSLIFIGGNSGDGAALSSAQRIVSGIAQGARGQAILKNAQTRLIIYSESSGNDEIDKRLRFFGIIYRDPDDSNKWIAATQGTYLPEGIYFDPDLSSDKSSDWSKEKMNLEYPRATSQGETGDEYYYYSFESNGTSTDVSNPWLVIRAGLLKPSSSGYTVEFPALDTEEGFLLRAGLIIRRSGTTTLVNNPEDIK